MLARASLTILAADQILTCNLLVEASLQDEQSVQNCRSHSGTRNGSAALKALGMLDTTQ